MTRGRGDDRGGSGTTPKADPHGTTAVRCLHVTTVPMTLGFLSGQVSYMRERGLDLHALSAPGADLEEFGSRCGVPTYSVVMERSVTPLRDVVAVGRMVRLLRRVRPTIVHAHTPKGGLLGMIAAFMARVPVRIYHMRGLPFMGARGARGALLRATERVSCRLAHRVICVSHTLREVAVREGICAPSRIGVLGNGSGQGVDARERFNPANVRADSRWTVRKRLGIPREAVAIGFIGRLVREKGIGELESAWQVLRARYPELHLVLAGPWEPQDPVAPEVRRRLEEDARAHLPGLVADTPSLYAALDVVVLPSYREGFPNVPLEGAAMGLPVVATRIPGCVEAVADGITGSLVPLHDVQALTHAISRYVEDPDLRRTHGATGRERVQRDFRPELVYESLYREYCALLDARCGVLPVAMVPTGTAP